jgi:hypothetical protein
MTARRRAALRKAQLASARKRRGKPVSRRKKIAGGVLVGIGGLAVARHIVTGSRVNVTYKKGPKGGNMRENTLKAYFGHHNGKEMLMSQKDWPRFMRIRDEYYPGNMRGFVLRSRRRRVAVQYTHVNTYSDRRLHATARKDKAYIKQQNKIDRQFKKTTKGM